MKKIIKRINLSGGMKSVLKISSGTMIGQMISMISLPILTRIYGATVIGVWSTIVALANIVNAFSDLGMTNAIMIGKDEEEVGKIYRVISTIVTACALCAGIVVYIYYQFVENDNGISLSFLVSFLIVYIWTSQQTQICYAWLNRKGQYDLLMKNPLINNISITIIAVGLGLAGMKQYGYYVGCMTGQILTLIHMKRTLPTHTFTFKINEYKDIFITYSHFLKYQLPTNLIASVKNQLPTLLIRSLFGNEILGYYSVTMRILQIPINLLANSIGRVYFKTISEMKRENKPIGEYTLRNLKKAMKIAILPMIGLLSVGEQFIIIFFGKQWEVAGQLLSIISCQTLFNFLMMSTQGISVTLDKQKYAMVSGISQMLGYVVAFVTGRYFFNSVYVAVILMSVFFIVIQVVYFCKLFEVMNISYKRYLKSVLPAFALILFVGLGLKYIILRTCIVSWINTIIS